MGDLYAEEANVDETLHTCDDTIDHLDFSYLEDVTKFAIIVISALANPIEAPYYGIEAQTEKLYPVWGIVAVKGVRVNS